MRVVRPPVQKGATAMGRLCLVARVDAASEFAEVVLVHSAPELATGTDGVVASSTGAAPYDTVVQTDLRGAVWTSQVGRLIGRLDESSLEALSAIALGVPTTRRAKGDEIWSGPPLTREDDSRWAFKAGEGSVFRSLTRACTAALLDDGTVWEIN